MQGTTNSLVVHEETQQSLDGLSLEELRGRVVEGHAAVEDARSLAQNHVQAALVAAWHTGRALIAAKGQLKGQKGRYLPWLAEAGVSQPTASRYTTLAKKLSEGDIAQLESKAEAYRLLGMVQPTEKDGPSLPTPPAHFGWVNRLMGYTRDLTCDSLDDASRTALMQLRKRLDDLLGEEVA